jgi:hypothetical protein
MRIFSPSALSAGPDARGVRVFVLAAIVGFLP